MPYTPDLCEWNPVDDRPARLQNDPGACQSEATVVVKNRPRNIGTLLLCEACSRLERFAGLDRKLIKTFRRARI